MAPHHPLPTNQPRNPGARLFDALQQWRDAGWTSVSECHVPERRTIDANRVTVERAKGMLMRRYGLDSFQAFSLMVRWARQTQTPVHTLAKTLVQGLAEEDPQTERRHRPLTRWLEGQLRNAER